MTSEPDDSAPHVLNREEISPWIEVAVDVRLNADVLQRLVTPRAGSVLFPSSADPWKGMRTWCYEFLDAAVSHLLLWADYAVPLKFHPEAEVSHELRPALTLARAAIECAAQAIWILGSDEPQERARRYIMIGLWDLGEQAKAAITLEARAEIRARRDEMLKMLGLTNRAFTPPLYLDLIRSGAAFLPDDGATPVTPDRVERIWRSAAGAAHGKHWLEQELFVPVEEDGQTYWIPSIEAMSEILEIASKFVSAGVYLFAIRGGRVDEWDDLWQAASVRLAVRTTPVVETKARERRS